MISTSQDGPIWTVVLGDDENRFTPAWLDDVERILGDIEGSGAPAALVTTGAGKFYSNGLDLDWIGVHPTELTRYVARVNKVLERVLTLPVPTVAAVNGHAYGAGAMLAMAHDYRVMRSDRGYLCFPEVDLQLPFEKGQAALVQSKLTPRAAVDAMTTGQRYSGTEAFAAGLVDGIGQTDGLHSLAVERIRPLAGKSPQTLGEIKLTMFADVVDALREPRFSAISTKP